MLNGHGRPHLPQRPPAQSTLGRASSDPVAPRRLRDGPAQRLFDTLDGDGNSRIAWSEWVQAFDWIDADSDGMITRKEFALAGGDTRMFDAFDRRHKCAVTRTEWQDAFQVVDADQSQEITVSEWTTWMACCTSHVGINSKQMERLAEEKERKRLEQAAKDKRPGAGLGRALRCPSAKGAVGVSPKRVHLDLTPSYEPDCDEASSMATMTSRASNAIPCQSSQVVDEDEEDVEEFASATRSFELSLRELQRLLEAGQEGEAVKVRRLCQRVTDTGTECVRLCQSMQKRLQHVGVTIVDEYGSSVAVTCICGNKFMDDARYCRKCGRKRPEEDPTVVLRRRLRSVLRGAARDGSLQPALELLAEREKACRKALRRKGAAGELEKTAYVGAYGQLVQFLRDCHANCPGQLPGAKLNTLLHAVEDLSRRDVEESMQSMRAKDRAREQGQEEAFSEIMGNLGISVAEKHRTRSRLNSAASRRLSTVSMCSNVGTLNPVAFLCDPNFDSRIKMGFKKKRDCQALVQTLETPFSLLSEYNIDERKVVSWMLSIAEAYGAHEVVTYHNWRHACDVFQFSFLSLLTGGASEYFSNKDMLSILLAGVGHDVGHPGTNNAFQVNTRSKWALVYNDKSVLENMHASMFFEVAQAPGADWLADMDKQDYDNVRSKVIEAILATDMAHHFELVDRFATRVSKKEDNPFFTSAQISGSRSPDTETKKATKADRRMLIQAFVHMADLGHCARPWDIHKQLVAGLENEFFTQGDKERELGMPIMPLMDREKDSAAASQDFFLGQLVLPLLEPYASFLQEQLANDFLENAYGNRKKWQDLVKTHGKKTATELIALEP